VGELGRKILQLRSIPLLPTRLRPNIKFHLDKTYPNSSFLSVPAAIGDAPGLNRSSFVLAYTLVGAAALVLALVDLALLVDASSPWPTWFLVSLPICISTYLVGGIVAGLRRPASRMGPLMVAAGLAWLVAELALSDVPALVVAGLILATVPLAIVYHLLLAFPTGRLRGRASVAAALAGYFVCTVMQAPQYLFGGGAEGPQTVLQVRNDPGLAEAGLWAQWAVGSVVTVAVAAILWRRWRRFAPSSRRSVAPLLAYGIAAVLYVPISGKLAHSFGASPTAVP
jgi:hypothetical protein